MLLKELVDLKHCNFVESCEDWQDAIGKCCIPLLEDESIDETYVQDIINCIKTHGAYIILLPGVGLPHAMKNAKGVKKNGISFMKAEEPVVFDENDPEKYANIFFTLAAMDEQAHMQNMKKLFRMLSNEELLAELLGVQSPNDLIRLDEKYFPEE